MKKTGAMVLVFGLITATGVVFTREELTYYLGQRIRNFSVLSDSYAAGSDVELYSFESADERKIRNLRESEIDQLTILLSRRQEKNRQAELYFRLAEIYLEAYRSTFLLEGRVHDKRIESGITGNKLDRSRSIPYLKRGVQACEQILKSGLSFDKLDRVYFFLGYNYSELGDDNQSQKYFELLSARFPNSPFAVQADQEIADTYYRDLKFKKAKEYYLKAVARADKDAQPRLYHKLAWTQYRMREFDGAIASMKKAVKSSGENGEKFLSVREEALKDISVFLTETGRVEEAIQYFQSVAGDKAYYPKLLEKLGRQYERNVEPQKATVVYETLLKTHPDDEVAFRVRVKIFDLDLRRGKVQEAIERIKTAKIPLEGEKETKTAVMNLKAMLRRTATENHEQFRKKGSLAALQIAETYYQAYLNIFLLPRGEKKEATEIKMYLAEVEKELGKVAAASALYKDVFNSGDDRYAKEAALLWVASLAETIKKKESEKGANGKQAEEPSAVEVEFVAAADAVEEILGNLTESHEAALRATQVLAGYPKTREDAINRCQKMVKKWPKSRQTLIGARLWIQTLADQLPKDSTKVEDSKPGQKLSKAIAIIGENSELLENDQASNLQPKLKDLIELYDHRLRVGEIAAKEQSKDFSAAARGYESYGDVEKSKDRVETAYSSAMFSYLKGVDFTGAANLSTKWIQKYPSSKKALDSTRNLATALFIAGKMEESANQFSVIGEKAGDGTAVLTAARLYEGLLQFARSRVLLISYLKAFSKSEKIGSVYLWLAASYENEHFESEAEKVYRMCWENGTTDESTECGTRLGDMYLRLKDLDRAKTVFIKVSAVGEKKKGKGSKADRAEKAPVQTALSPFVAYARFKLAEFNENEIHFKNALEFPEKQLKAAVNERIESIETLSRVYHKALDAGGPWAVAALDRLATWVEKLADDIELTTIPSDFSDKSQADYRKQLENFATGIRKKAAATFSQALDEGRKNEWYSPHIIHASDRLGALNGRKGLAQGPRGRLRLSGVPADGGPEGRATSLEKVRERLVLNPKEVKAWVDYGNLLWGEGRPLLARIAYERALELDSKHSAALNNRAVVAISGSGEEDWVRIAEAMDAFKTVLTTDGFFLAAKMNRATVANYYRVFSKAKTLWEQVLEKHTPPDAYDGLGVAMVGLENDLEAEKQFEKAETQGAGKERWTKVFHKAVTQPKNSDCLSILNSMNGVELMGFEREAFESAKKTCGKP